MENIIRKSNCIPENSHIVHPITLNIISNTKNVYFTNPFYSGNDILDYIQCDKSDKLDPINDPYLSSIVSPNLSFDDASFLHIVYKINTYDDGINWLNNNTHLSKLTVNRIIDSMIYVFKDDIKNDINTFVTIIYDYISRYYPKYKNHSNIKNYIKDAIKINLNNDSQSFIKKTIYSIKYFITKNI